MELNQIGQSSTRYFFRTSIISYLRQRFSKDSKKGLHCLQRMACGIKVLNALSKSLPQKTKIFLLNAIVISHLHYSGLILTGLHKSLLTTSKKQLNWGTKTIFNRRKYDRSTDLKIRNKILPVSFLLKYHCSKQFFSPSQQRSSTI